MFQRLTGAISATVEAASSLNEQIAASEVVFGNAAPKIQEFARGAEDIGLASDQALSAANNFGALFTALGITQERAAELGPTLIQRAADLASFRNVAGGTEEVIQRLSSGIVGEVEPLRRLGVVINETVVAERARKLGLVDLNGEVTESGKVQARIALILEQSSLAAGDFARTSDGLANTQRRLAAEFRNVQIEAGERFLPIVLAGVNALSDMLDVFTSLPGPIQTTVLALAGLATAAVGIGLAALAVQRLRTALESAGVAGATASRALRGLAIGSGVLAGITVLVGLIQAVGGAAKSTAEDVRDLSRATDEALAKEFASLTQPRPSVPKVITGFGEGGKLDDPVATLRMNERIDLEKRFQKVAQDSLPLAKSIRAALQAQGEDVSFLTKTIDKEALAQERANKRTAEVAPTVASATGAMDELDKALKAVSDTLDAIFGRFLDAEDAQLALRDAVFDTAEALGRGQEKGESYLRFQDRLAGLANNLARQVETTTLALARSGDISKEAVPQVMRERLEELITTFPELRGQLQGYIDLLGETPTEVKTEAVFDDRRARSNLSGWAQSLRGFESALRRTNADIDALGAGGAAEGAAAHFGGIGFTEEFAGGITSNLDEVADAGRDAGRAAAEAALDEVRTTLRRSGRTGFDIGGFLVEGINLGGADAAIREANARLAKTSGRADLIGQFAQINPQEQLDVLRAVEAADQAAKDLAETRAELGANSIEAAIAERALGVAQEQVNKTILESIDASVELNELLEKEREARDKVTDSIRAAEGALRSLSALQDARKEAQKEGGRLAQFDQRISEAQAELARIRAGGGGGTLEEARALATLNDLLARRVGQVEKTNDANLDLIDAQLQLVEAGDAVLGMEGRWVEYFTTIAGQAGLSADAVGRLVKELEAAAGLAVGARTAAVSGAPSPLTAAGAGGGGVVIENLTIVEASSARGTAVELIDELRAVALLGAG